MIDGAAATAAETVAAGTATGMDEAVEVLPAPDAALATGPGAATAAACDQT